MLKPTELLRKATVLPVFFLCHTQALQKGFKERLPPAPAGMHQQNIIMNELLHQPEGLL